MLNGSRAVCICNAGFTGPTCDTPLGDNCTLDNDCPNGSFCQVLCPTDSYPSHTSLIDVQVPVEFTGTAFIRASPNQYPDLSGNISLFTAFSQSPGSRGYLYFQGPSGEVRNFAVYLDGGTHRIWFYYTDVAANLQSENFQAFFSDGSMHYFALTYDNTTNRVRFYMDDFEVHTALLDRPDFHASVSSVGWIVFLLCVYATHSIYLLNLLQNDF